MYCDAWRQRRGATANGCEKTPSSKQRGTHTTDYQSLVESTKLLILQLSSMEGIEMVIDFEYAVG
jgi:hypothetical protein